MKYIVLICTILMMLSCNTSAIGNKINNKNEIAPQKNENGEWDLDVLDTQYSYFLNAIAQPINMYSQNYLKNRNTFLVTEWNGYYYSGRYKNIIESAIDYNPQENYGLEFEYKLYQVFAFVQWKYGLKMRGLSQSDIK